MFLFFITDSFIDPVAPLYCPQTTPDYTIPFTITITFDTTNYCPLPVPDYSFAQAP